ncbi:MAG TPA: TAXI family TRAP transporter solute-binding subunit, partial [Spirochaetota bacterium]|nr:TAXI family TRAP transporter solute-binding subunit [Spirochaetota bacterium]
MKTLKFIFLLCTVLLYFTCSSKDTSYITIGSGSLSGVYYPVAGKIAEFVNARKADYGIKAIHQSTGGSVFNINAVLSGNMDFGIAQSDRQYQAVKGMAEWQERGSRTNLRAVCSLHPEMITLIASGPSGIKSVADLVGKKVNIGNVGSGHRQNALDVLKNYGIDCENDIYAESVKAGEAPSLIQDERIDAFFYTVGHPNGNIKEATAGRIPVRFIPIKDVDNWLAQYPYM